MARNTDGQPWSSHWTCFPVPLGDKVCSPPWPLVGLVKGLACKHCLELSDQAHLSIPRAQFCGWVRRIVWSTVASQQFLGSPGEMGQKLAGGMPLRAQGEPCCTLG